MSKTQFKFEEIKKALSDIPDNDNKIKFLLEAKYDYLQSPVTAKFFASPEFDRLCELEIEKLERMIGYQTANQVLVSGNASSTFSNGQMVLILYYFLKSQALWPRDNQMDIAPFAKFLHLITGKEFTNINNSDYYRRLNKAPNFNSDKSLLDDLNKIRPLFEEVGLNNALTEIDKEISTAKKERRKTKSNKI